ncbi:carboxypeptidase regulatory-like domain-containing protein [Lacipirellula sp.]|uniref:carboxypeptidase regulatory-like domain-containing protein n=1 Tax=Lacipirellula sp. TaxID=2691419 RepID=UPI003D13AC9F
MVAASSIEFCWFLVDVTLKSLLVAAIAWAGLKVTRTRDANARHHVWTLMLAAMLGMPLFTAALPRLSAPVWLPTETAYTSSTSAWQQAATTAATPVAAIDVPYPATANDDVASASAAAVGASDEAPSSAEHARPIATATRDVKRAPMTWSGLLAMLYAIVATSRIGRLILGLAMARRLVRRGRSLDAESRIRAFSTPCPATVLESPDVRVPVTVGFWRSAILLPRDWSTWDDETLRLVVAHETIHSNRRDALIALAAHVNSALYWFNPLAWFLRRKLASLAEQACDDEVLREHRDRHAYAQTLLTIASRLAGGGWVCAPFVAMARQAQVEERIIAIIDETRPLAQRFGRGRTIVLGALAAPLIAITAMLGPSPADGADTPPTDAPKPAAVSETTSPKAEEEKAEQPAQTPPATSPHVAGRVVNDADGQPVAGAEVRLSGWNKGRTRYDTKTAITNGEGRFSIDELPTGKLQIIALKDDTASRTSLYKGQQVNAGDEAVELRMRPAPGLQVQVIDRATQAPLKDAMVLLTWADIPRDYHTDSEGIATIRGLTNETWTLEVFAKGYAEGNEAIQLQGVGQTPVTIALDPGFELSGVVADEQQQPLAGVGISVFPGDHRGPQIEYLKTDDAGKYRFANLPLSGLKLYLDKTGYSDLRLDMSPLVTAGETQEGNFTLLKRPDGGSITGQVVDNAGKPLAGVKITNSGNSSRDLRETTTDAEGRYRLDDVFEGSQGHVAIFKLPGYAPGIVEFSPGSHDKPTVVDVKLSLGHRLVGRVVDEQGAPISGVYVEQGGRFGMAGRDDGSLVVTADDGRFVFDTLPAGARFNLRKQGFSPINDEALPLDRDEEIVIKFASQGVVRGRAVDAVTGESIKKFIVHVTFSPDRTPEDPNGTLMGPAVGGGETFVSDQGEFEVGNFTRGMPLQVTVDATGYQRQVVRRVVAAAADVAEPVEFSLKPIDKSQLRTYAGKLVDNAGQGIAGVEVRLIMSDRIRDGRRDDPFPFNWTMIRTGQLADQADAKQFLTAVTDAQGNFEFRDVLPARDVELVYWGPGVAQTRLGGAKSPFDATQQRTTFTATATGTVAGTIDPAAYPRLNDVAISGRDDIISGEISPDGKSYEIGNAPPGKYELQVYIRKPIAPARQTDGYDIEVIHRQPVEVKSGETTTVNLKDRETP